MMIVSHQISVQAATALLAAFALVCGLGGAITSAAEADTFPAKAHAAGSESDYIVLYKSGANLTAKVQSEEARGNDVQDVFRSAVKGFVAPLDAADVRRLRARSDVLLVEKDKPVRALSAGPRSGLAASWGLDRIDQRTLPLNSQISTSENGFGITAYIIDTGIRADHNEFGGRATIGFDAIGDGQNTNDCNGHGTHVAGTVGGATYGVAPQVSLVAVRVLDCLGEGFTSGVIGGIDWATANHAPGVPAVANMSLGGSYSPALNTATQNAITDGISFAVAAGNESADACYSSPASTPNAITVAATESNDARAYYSNWGSCIDIFAPGSSITSAWNTSSTATNTISGTSMAAPHVAGAAALILSGSPSSTPAQVATALTAASTTGVVTDPGTDSVNRLLFTGAASVPNPTPLPAPAPPPPPPPTPANDNFVNAVALSSLAAVTGTTVSATHETGEPDHGSDFESAASVWYSWTASADGTLALSTQGSGYDTLLAAYSGSAVSGLTQRAANDDASGGSWSQVSFNVTAGIVYRIAVDGYRGATGTTSLAGTFIAGAPAPYPLTLTRTGAGSGSVSLSPAGIGELNCDLVCSYNFSPSTSVTLTASPADGSSFTGWSGSGCSGTSTCAVTMSAPRAVAAEFAVVPPPVRFNLALSKSGTGSGTVTSSPAGINCGSDCSAILKNGSSVTLTAKPTTGSSFAGWSGSECSGTSTCTVTMSAARAVSAEFTKSSSSNLFRIRSVKAGVKALTSTVVVRGRGTLSQRVTRNRSAKSAAVLTVCKTSGKATKAGTVKLTCKLSAATRSVLRKASLRVNVKTTFTPTGGLPTSKLQVMTLKRRH